MSSRFGDGENDFFFQPCSSSHLTGFVQETDWLPSSRLLVLSTVVPLFHTSNEHLKIVFSGDVKVCAWGWVVANTSSCSLAPPPLHSPSFSCPVLHPPSSSRFSLSEVVSLLNMSNDVVIYVSLHLSMSDGRAGVWWMCVVMVGGG